jgi:hypothetical protein
MASGLLCAQNAAFFGSNAATGTLLLVSDNFTRTNATTLGANWTDSLGNTNSLAISSNTAIAHVAAGSSEIWTANSFTANQFSKATFTTLGDADIQVMVRTLAATANGYACGRRLALSGSGYYVLFKLVSGTLTEIGIPGVNFVTAGDVVYLSAVGTTITCNVNGVPQLTGTDSSLSSGSPGLRLSYTSTNGAFTLWSGGNL